MTPQEEIQIRQMLASQRAAGQSGRNPLQGVARFGDPFTPEYGIPRPPERGRNPTPISPVFPPGYEYRQSGPSITPEESARISAETAAREDYIRRRNEAYYAGGIDLNRLSGAAMINPDGTRFVPDNTRYGGVNPNYYTGGTPLSSVGETPIIEGASEEYDGFVDSGTGERGYMGGKYMPAPMDAPVAMAQAAPVAMAYNAPPALALSDPEEYDRRIQAYYRRPVAEGQQRTQEAYASAADVVARNAPANTAYMPPPTAAPVNTAYMPPPQAAPVNTAYMPPAQANTAYNAPLRRSPSSASTGFNPQPLPVATTTTPSYGMSTPSYGMSNATTTTPTYRGQATEQPSYSPKQAGKYNVDGTRLRNTGGLFNDLNAFFGRPQT